MKITVLDRLSMGTDLDFSAALTPISSDAIFVFDETPAELLLDHIGDAEVIILNKVKINGETIKSCPNLKLICVFATGYDNIDVKTAKEHGVAVCNVPAYSTESVVLLTISTAMALLSKLPLFSEYVKSGSYTASGVPNYLSPVFHECQGLTWGILGCGSIGSRVAEIAKALGMNVIVSQRHPKDGYENVSLNELCKRSDVISLHCPLTDQTRGIIGEKELSLMKPTAIIVNEARGAVLDESAVAEAVLSGKIGGFGCDVYSCEPFSENHPYNRLHGCKNVILTPHIAWAAYESRVRCLDVILQNILNFYDEKTLNRVDK